MKLAGRVDKLEQRGPPDQGDRSAQAERNFEIILMGFDDVAAWLDGVGAAPCPHRLAHLLRWPYQAGVRLDDVNFFLDLAVATGEIVARRRQERTGENPPTDDAGTWWDWVFEFANQVDGVGNLLLYNADQWVEHATAIRDGRRTEQDPVIGHLRVMPMTDECGAGCPRRRLTGR